MMTNKALEKAVALAGGQSALAEELKSLYPESRESLRQGHIWKWINRSKSLVPPAEYVLDIEKIVDGAVTRHELRPDLYPLEESAA